jgi:ubiquinone/menaquinone biosynthesis C-methylase UbiE
MIDSLERAWWSLVRFGFRLLYNELAFTYDVVSWVVSLGQWRCWQRTALKHIAPPGSGNVLDLAHGTGNLHIDLKDAGYRTVGFDLSRHMGHITTLKLEQRDQKARLVRGYGQSLPFDDNSFASIVCTFPTPFIFEQETIVECYRVLKPGGKLAIVLSGMLTGGLGANLIEYIYRITGQHSDDPINESVLSGFRHEGFDASLVYETCPNSQVLLIVAQKT